MKESRQADMTKPSSSDELDKVLGQELAKKYQDLRGRFEADHPELFREDSCQPWPERKKTQDERNRLWSQSLGLDEPPVPSALDHTRDATCLKCHDVGWVLPGNYAADAIPCPHCNAQDESRARARLAYAGIPDTQKAATFESFKRLPGTEAAFNAAHDLVFGAQFTMVLLVGAYGNGKTHLAYAAVREAAKLGMRARFVYLPDMLAEYRRRIDRKEEPQVYIEDVKRSQFLALDEIGFLNATPFQEGLLEELVNHRYNEGLHTIMTTNRPPESLPGPILSRFKDKLVAKMVLNKGEDYRPKKRTAKTVGPGTTD